ncbi:proteasome core particle subunit beta 2 [Coemansia sp. RSA 552]|nr:proteasome core particle subunit beta 2 [Coemansia sp. RSA 552]
MTLLADTDAGFKFDNVKRNQLLGDKGYTLPTATKTGTTIVGLVYKDGVVLGADTRATNGTIVADKNCRKIHYLAPNMYCCGAGTAADTDFTTNMISSQLALHSLNTGREARVVTAMTMLKQYLFRYQGHIGAALVLGGFDVTGPHLFTIYPHGSTDKLPFVTMGSGSLAAMSVFESCWRPDLSRDEAIGLVNDAIEAGIFNDLGSGSNVDVCVITRGNVEYLRGHTRPNERARKEQSYRFAPGTTEFIARGQDATAMDPCRRILAPGDMPAWLRSPAYKEIASFAEQLSKSAEGRTISAQPAASASVQGICALLDSAEAWIADFPPDTSSASRFGNTSFRLWTAELERRAPQLLRDLLPEKSHGAIVELTPYLAEAFGNATRIDYGSGHELSFLVWLLCLCKIGFLDPSDSSAIVLTAFQRYISLCQRLQRTYRLEPAGSHGVWGLDDYQFLPFYFGSAQFIGTSVTPADSVSPRIVEEMHKDYMYLQGIRFIMEMKRGPFFEHSRQLYDISGVPRWEKVNQGLGKMYRAEVLGKFPVVQHLRFGRLLEFCGDQAEPATGL